MKPGPTGATVSSDGLYSDSTTDSEFVEALRAGDTRAYEALWMRHVGSARAVGRRLTAINHEDLVSEAFLTIYTQVYVDGKGPQTSFRAYLFAVMRNIAARWYREGKPLVSDPDVDVSIDDETSTRLENAEQDQLLLTAFRALPDRWQRVLWLSEIEDTPRPQIAAEFGIRPNAVSALQRRAKRGLRESWLLEHVPASLRQNPAHVAADLPSWTLGTSKTAVATARHVEECGACAEVAAELRTVYADTRRTAVSIGGLAALGVVLPSASSLALAPTSIAIASGIGFTLVSSAAALIGVLALGVGTGLIPLTLSSEDDTNALPPPAKETTLETRDNRIASVPLPEAAAAPFEPDGGLSGPWPSPPVETLDIMYIDSESGIDLSRPTPTPPTAPDGIPPAGDNSPEDSAPTYTLASNSPFFAPTLTGTAEPGALVAVGLAQDTYAVSPAESGEWVFDMRALQLDAGEYNATVWTVTNGVPSAAAPVTFRVSPIEVEGFMEYHPMTLRESLSEGIVFTVTGAPSGTICFASDTGQTAEIPLDDAGTATRRLRFLSYGIYVMNLTACDSGFSGAHLGRVVSINEGLMDPWIVDDSMIWELEEP